MDDSNHIYIVSLGGEFHIYEAETKEKLFECFKYNHQYHWISLSNKQDKCLISCYDGKQRIFDIRDKRKPELIDEFSINMMMILTQHWHPSDQVILLGGRSHNFALHEVEAKIHHMIKGHNVDNIIWLSWVDDGNKALTTDSNETILWDTSDLINTSNWTIIFRLNDKLFPLLAYNRNLVAIIHNNKVRYWSEKLVEEFIT